MGDEKKDFKEIKKKKELLHSLKSFKRRKEIDKGAYPAQEALSLHI